MKFFIPHAEDDAQAERVYSSVVEFVGALSEPSLEKRLFSISWTHNGKRYSTKIGDILPPYFGVGEEPVIAIVDMGGCYGICTPSRGVLRGDPVLAGKDFNTHVTMFGQA